MIKVGFKKIAALLLTLTLILPMVPFAASAAEGDIDPALIDTGKTGSITVTKYASANANATKGDATGTDNDSVDGAYEPLNGATFKLFQIADANAVKEYYNGTSTTTYSLDQFTYQDDGTASYNGSVISDTNILTGETTGNGTFKFDNLPVGIYVLKEVTAPNQIAAPLAEDSLISIPMVNTASSSNNGNAEWMYKVFVYPKNHASTGTVELTKQDQNGAKLKDVTFQLSKAEFQSTESGLALPKDANNKIIWTDVTKTVNNSGSEQKLEFTTDVDGKLTLANLPSGLYGTQYKLVEVSAPNGYIVNQTPLYFKVNTNNKITWNTDTTGECQNKNTGVTAHDDSTDATKLSITLRNELPSLKKEVQENGGTTWKTDEQYRLDDEITYRLTVYVPNNVAELGTFVISDAVDSGITYGNKITISSDVTTLNTGFTRTIATDGKSFTLTFNTTDESVKSAISGKKLTITYDAYMNDSAVIAGNGNGNTATLTYSKYIGNTDPSTYAITDEARVYTYQFQITKRKDSAQGEVAGGVEFNLLYSATGNPVEVYQEAEGVYRLWLTSDTDTAKRTTTLTTKSDGTILLKGLENGTYYLKETKTINGYNLLSAPFAIQVNVTETTTWRPDRWQDGTAFSDTGKAVKTYGSTTYAAYGAADPTGTSTIINKKGFVLPQTGGMGYLLFCTVGIVLIAGGAALIFGGRKKKIR